ncbi:tetratricopeptide repeat protein [Abyssibacter sp.]|uniref:tetratricopeptide repeat protein n=1 Tax=Abyssibacter sp. TaxID=2320200 RepID=UPI0025C180BB|nr:tetratricopeptide repeat protein [Abyssibacter sp.]MCK5860434.1 tetratricopeptide repeat protein [Abyssibacter sp.]
MLIQRILVTLIPVALLAGCVSAPEPGDRLNALFEAAGGPAAPPAEPLPQRAQAMYHVLAGQVAGDRGDLALAAEEYLEAARLTGQADIAKEATRYALASNNRALSVQASQLWRTAAPDNVQAQEAAFRVAVRARSYDTALDMAKAYVAAEPERRGEALRAVAATLVRDNVEAGPSLAIMQPLVEANAESADAHYALGLVAMNVEDWAVAQQAAERARELRPDWTEATLLQAGVLIKQQRVLEGIAVIDPLVNKGDNADVRFALARLLLEADALELAEAQLDRVLEEDPKHPEARYARGLLALDRQNLDLAEKHFLELIEQPSQRFDAAYYLGRIAEARDDLDAARGWYRRVAGGRHQADALTRRAYLMAEGGHVEEAQAYLQGLARINPSMDLQLKLVEADILLQSGQPAAALEIYSTGLAAYPQEPDLLYGRSLAHEQLGQIDQAIADLRQMVALNDNDSRALNALGYILTNHTDRYTEARGYIARALEQRPDDPAVIDSMGWVEFRLGNLDAAAEYLRRAYDTLGDPEIAAHLGEVLWKMGERDEARRVWDTALAQHPEHGTLQETITRLSP